jgi:cytochrome P450
MDDAWLQWHVALPMLFGGSVAPNPWFVPCLVRSETAAKTFQFLRDVRKKYGPRAWSLFPVKSGLPFLVSTLLVLDADGIEEVLDSHDNFADPTIKTLVLSRFTPNGVIISRGDEWSTRRAFNEKALGFGVQSHPDADEFLQIIKAEVHQLLTTSSGVLAWNDFNALAERISQQVILGRGRFEPGLAKPLTRLIAASNWFIRRPCPFSAVYEGIHDHLDRSTPRPGGYPSLVQQGADWLTTHESARAIAEASSQIAFWLFVLKDALQLHISRTLALIASAPTGVRDLLQQELQRPAGLATSDIDALPLLEACVKEQLRLWTPVPVLLRVAVEDHMLSDGTPVRAGQQLLVHTGFYHRDSDVFGAVANRFDPLSRAASDVPDCQSVTNSSPPLYIFSRHRQACAGQFLAMFVLKATLACVLTEVQVSLVDQSIDVESVPAAIDHFHMRFKTAPGP